MSEHEWFHEHLTLYGAGGLAADECGRLERHAAQCAACAQELAQWRLFDQGLDRLCAPVQFAADFEERVLTKWRVTLKPPRRWPAVARWAAAAAAVMLVAALGAAVMAVAEQGMLAFPGGSLVQADPKTTLGVDLVGGSTVVYDDSNSMNEPREGNWFYTPQGGRRQSRNELKQIPMVPHSVNGELAELSKDRSMLSGQGHHGPNLSDDMSRVADIQNANTIEHFPPALGLITRADSTHTTIAGGVIGGKYVKNEESAPAAMPSAPFSSAKRNLGVSSAASGLTPSGTMTPDVNTPINCASQDSGVSSWEDNGRTVRMGGITKRLDDLHKIQAGEMIVGQPPALADGSVRTTMTPPSAYLRRAPEDVLKLTQEAKDLIAQVKESHTGSLLFGAGVPKAPAAQAEEKSEKANDVAEKSAAKHTALILKSTTEYHNLSYGAARGFMDTDGSATGLTPPAFVGSGAQALKEQGEAIKKLDKAISGRRPTDMGLSNAEKDASVAGAAKPQERVGIIGGQPIAVAQPKPDPQVAQRKIIRTGDLEFEVDLFDNTVAQINKLIGAIPGAFVMTVNSEKLPNGKMKGSIVVRMPPEHLDKFVLNLRKDLAKAGELKSQRVGSQDVTKQYTDIESRLRAARAMEERLIKIIQNGKGEIKDLIAAERELGVWRTKIEEYEGEIRYYNNQVALSTLTITAYEREIRAAAAMVITEQVTMKIETDDVEKSLQAALSAVTEAKGRVTKSELKQHAAGQLEAEVNFEVAPAAAGPVKDKLRKLGIVTHHDAQRLQQAEGGPAPSGEPIKSRTNDVRFQVKLYNVANIKPRQEFNLQVAVADVAAEYHRLLELVLQSSGQVRVSQLDEKDKTNIFAQLDFDVPSTKRELFDKQLPAVGDVVSRHTTRAGPGETATDRKVGYRLLLKSETSIPPRETFAVQAYSLDVPGAFKRLHEAALQAKGTVRVVQLDEKDKTNVTGQLDFDVPAGEQSAVDKLLDEVGDVYSRTTSRKQPGEVATGKKLGYRVTLLGRIPPRETIDLNIEVKNVDQAATRLVDLVLAAKGKVIDAATTEDRAGNAIAVRLFDVPLSARDEVVSKLKLVGDIRGQKASQNLQAPDTKLGKVQILVRVTNLTPIVPDDQGLWAQMRTSLGYAFRLLSVSLMFVVVGVFVILPWALVLWVAVKLVRRARGKSQVA
ncbi:MAG: DUF4349 domain-containing protein [Gemmataceae bacterium]|nr:DUF4349 domain-containing protein [Gemmataceae bacterium]